MKKKAVIAIGIVLFLIQFIRIDKHNPPIDPKLDFYSKYDVPMDVKTLLHNACDDCHSHSVKYPWYTNIQPVGWWIKGHINGGLEHLNFSVWNEYDVPKQNHKIDECIEYIEKGWMPLGTYKFLHPEAKLTEEERKRMVAFFESIRVM